VGGQERARARRYALGEVPGQSGFDHGVELDRHLRGCYRLVDAQRLFAQHGLEQVVRDQQAHQEAQAAGFLLGTQCFQRAAIEQIGIAPQQLFDALLIRGVAGRHTRHQGREARRGDVPCLPAAGGIWQHIQ